MEFLGFGRESSAAVADGPPAPPKFYRHIPDSHECCETCDVIRPRSEMTYIGQGGAEDHAPLYACREHGDAVL